MKKLSARVARSVVSHTAAAVALATVATGCGALLNTIHGTPSHIDDQPSNTFVAANLGNIVFSTKPIAHDVAAGDSLSTTFGLDQSVFWRPFYKHSPYNSIVAAHMDCDDENHYYELEARNADVATEEWSPLVTNPQTKADLAFMSWLTMEQPTLLGKSTDGSPGIGQSFVTYLMKQPRGTVNVELRYSAMCFGPAGNGQPKKQPAVELARGKVSFNVTESAIAAYESANGMARTAVAFAHSGDAKHIEAEARALVKGKPVVAFFMAQREWNIKRNEYGRIMSREAEGTIVVRDTTICLAYDFLAIEANTGADDFVETPALRDPTFGSKPTGTPISCQSIPKTN